VKEWLKNIKLNEEKISRVLGILIVVLTGLLLFNYFKSVNKTGQTGDASNTTLETSKPAEQMSVEETVNKGLPAEYTVKPGDSLWTIAETAYNSGYKWTDVYQANKTAIANPNVLLVGQKITLPKLEVAQIKTVEYTVAKGDSLWNIGLKLCNNGYVWPQIATDNRIPNPSVIHAGLVLKVNCGK
jgi:nucleoid-associated protein YgaU